MTRSIEFYHLSLSSADFIAIRYTGNGKKIVVTPESDGPEDGIIIVIESMEPFEHTQNMRIRIGLGNARTKAKT